LKKEQNKQQIKKDLEALMNKLGVKDVSELSKYMS